jgi:anti-sigma factor RsiW
MSHMDERVKSQACPKFEAVLEDYISDELNGAEKERVAAHLRDCGGCAAAVEATLHGRAILRLGAEPIEAPGPFFARRVMTRIQALDEGAAAEKGFWKPLEVLAMRAVWASAAAITLLVAYVNLSGLPQRQTVAEVRAADQGGLFSDPAPAPMSRDDVFLNITDAGNGK